MASGKTARRLLSFPKPTDAPQVTKDIETLANQLDSDVEGGQGDLGAKPATKISGRLYMVQGSATAANNGILWWDTGSGWIAVNAPPSANYNASQALVIGTEVEPCPGNLAEIQVTMTKTTATGELAGTIEINGKVIAPQKIKTAEVGDTLYFSFVVSAGLKFKLTNQGAAASATWQRKELVGN